MTLTVTIHMFQIIMSSTYDFSSYEPISGLHFQVKGTSILFTVYATGTGKTKSETKLKTWFQSVRQ